MNSLSKLLICDLLCAKSKTDIAGDIATADIKTPKAIFDAIDVPFDIFSNVELWFMSDIVLLGSILDIFTVAINYA
jgi:hypothetical protein